MRTWALQQIRGGWSKCLWVNVRVSLVNELKTFKWFSQEFSISVSHENVRWYNLVCDKCFESRCVRQEKSHLIWKSAIITLSCTNYKQTYCLRVYADQSRERWSMIMCHSSSLKEGQLLREVTPDRWTQRLGCVSFSLCFPSYSTSLSCFACSPQALRRDEPLASIYLSTKRFRLWPTFHCSKIRATSIWAKKGRSELPCQKWA